MPEEIEKFNSLSSEDFPEDFPSGKGTSSIPSAEKEESWKWGQQLKSMQVFNAMVGAFEAASDNYERVAVVNAGYNIAIYKEKEGKYHVLYYPSSDSQESLYCLENILKTIQENKNTIDEELKKKYINLDFDTVCQNAVKYYPITQEKQSGFWVKRDHFIMAMVDEKGKLSIQDSLSSILDYDNSYLTNTLLIKPLTEKYILKQGIKEKKELSVENKKALNKEIIEKSGLPKCTGKQIDDWSCGYRIINFIENKIKGLKLSGSEVTREMIWRYRAYACNGYNVYNEENLDQKVVINAILEEMQVYLDARKKEKQGLLKLFGFFGKDIDYVNRKTNFSEIKKHFDGEAEITDVSKFLANSIKEFDTFAFSHRYRDLLKILQQVQENTPDVKKLSK